MNIPPLTTPAGWAFQTGDFVKKIRGSQWSGYVVGFYSTSLTPEGYAVESCTEKGSVQIYPVSALESATPPVVAAYLVEHVASEQCDVAVTHVEAERIGAEMQAGHLSWTGEDIPAVLLPLTLLNLE